jgi:hypothetical protein
VQITKRLIAIGVASAATVATGLGVATTVDTASATAPTARVRHLKFVITDGPTHRVGPRSFAGTGVDRHQGKIVGYDNFSAKANFQTGKAFLRAAFSRRGGLLFVHATVGDHGPFSGKVTGGRGRFSGARGTVTGFAPKHSNKTFVRIRYHF